MNFQWPMSWEPLFTGRHSGGMPLPWDNLQYFIKMKVASWNVNGIRACIRKGFLSSLDEMNPDIIGLQEIKASDIIDFQRPDFPQGDLGICRLS